VRIGGALFVALLFIGAAYAFSGPSIFSGNTVNAESTADVLKAYAAKDSDNDGLPDWEEALYGTDPKKAISNSFGILDGEAVQKGLLTPQTLKNQLPKADTSADNITLPGVDPAAGSVTEQFSQEFLQAYTAASSDGKTLSASDTQALISKLLANIETRSAKIYASNYTQISLHTSTSVTVLQYADAVEQILRKDDLPKDASDPVAIMNALVVNQDETARPKLKTISTTYSQLTKDLLATPVPPTLVAQHLELIQAFDTLSKVTGSVVVYEKDPVGVLSSLSAFQPAATKMQQGLVDIGTVLLQGGEPAANTPGSLILFLARIGKTS
jgi:hypothetical protein